MLAEKILTKIDKTRSDTAEMQMYLYNNGKIFIEISTIYR